MADDAVGGMGDEEATAGPRRRQADVASTVRGVRHALREASANDGIRRLGLAWMLGIAADGALTVVTLVVAFNLGGVVAAGLLGAVRMVPTVVVGMSASWLIERFRGDRMLVIVGLVRAVGAAMVGLVIATASPTGAGREATLIGLFAFATLTAAAGAAVRPTQVTLMPAIARSTDELVAANAMWSTGEGLGAFAGPFAAGVLMGLGLHAGVAGAAAVGFLVTALISAGLAFEHATDAAGGGRGSGGRFRLLDGLRTVRARPLLSWTVLGAYGQVLTRGLLNAFVVVVAIEILGMGQSGAGLLTAAMGLGGLVGATFAVAAGRPDRLVRTEIVALVFWGLPIALIGLAPVVELALAAMVVVGVANATYDVALFTLIQRACPNDVRAPVISVLETAIGLGAVTGGLLAPVLLLVFGTRGGIVVGGVILPLIALAMATRIGDRERVGAVGEDTVRLLRRVPVFAELPLTALERLAQGLVPFDAPAGAVLMRQGEPGDRFLVIESGTVEVLVDDRPIHRLGPGAGIGEIALVRRSPRTATVVAVTAVSGYGVDAPTFLAAAAGPSAAAVTERMVAANLARAGAAAGAE